MRCLVQSQVPIRSRTAVLACADMHTTGAEMVDASARLWDTKQTTAAAAAKSSESIATYTERERETDRQRGEGEREKTVAVS